MEKSKKSRQIPTPELKQLRCKHRELLTVVTALRGKVEKGRKQYEELKSKMEGTKLSLKRAERARTNAMGTLQKVKQTSYVVSQ